MGFAPPGAPPIALAFVPPFAPAGAPPSALAFTRVNAPVLAYAPPDAPVDTPVSADAPANAPTSIVITVDKATQRMSVKVNGEQRWNWPVSTGLRGYSTPSGSYKAFRMVRDHKSREWDNAPMPYSIFFTKRGHAIHGSFATHRLGSPASHGCVRLDPNNARQLFALVQQHGVSNATVIITGVEQAPSAYARANTAPKTQGKAQAKAPAVTFNAQPKTAQRTLLPQTQPQRLAYRPAPTINSAYRPPPSYQPPSQGYSRPLPITPPGFAPPAR
jgi:hypothetical protein